MTSYNYAIAKEVMNETDKDRFLCCYLNSTDMNAVNWEKAAADFGSASVQSFKKMISNAFKKVETAEANGGVAPSPAKTPGGKKRKGKEDGEEGTPAKKRGRKPKKEATPAEEDVETAGQGVKEEDME